MAKWVKLSDVQNYLKVSGGHLNYLLQQRGILTRKDFGQRNKLVDIELLPEVSESAVSIFDTRDITNAVSFSQLSEMSGMEIDNIRMILKRKIGVDYHFLLGKDSYFFVEDPYVKAFLTEYSYEGRRRYRKNCPSDCYLRRDLVVKFLMTEDEIADLIASQGVSVIHETEYGVYYKKSIVDKFVAQLEKSDDWFSFEEGLDEFDYSDLSFDCDDSDLTFI